MARTQVKERPAQTSFLPDPKPQPAAKLPAKPKPKKAEPSKAIAIAKPQPPAKPMSLLELCMMASRDKNMPPETVRAYLDMAKEQERAEAEILFDEAMLAAQREMPSIPRDAYNKHTKAWWAKIEGVSAKVDPVARAHGFTLKYGVGEPRMDDHYHLFVDVTWVGKLGSGKKTSFTKRYDADIGRDDKGPKGEGTKSLAQGAGSSITYGRRFLKLMVFDVLVLGMDKDGNPAGRERITAEQTKDVLAKLHKAQITAETFCEVYKIETVDQLGAAQLQDALDKVAAKQKLLDG